MNRDPGTNACNSGDRTVLTVRVGSPEEAFERPEDRFATLDDGDKPVRTFEVVRHREEDLNRLLSPNTVKLLRTIAREQPGSIRETARLVDRDVEQVHDDLSELGRLNLVQFENHGPAKRPVVRSDGIDGELPNSLGAPSAPPPDPP